MIGGIEIFLPLSPAEAREDVVSAPTEERQPTETFMEKEMEQPLMTAQAKEKEHSEEWLKYFSQIAETKTTATLKLIAREEKEHAVKMLTPWEMELEMLEDWLNNPELVDDCHEKTVMQKIEEECSEESLRIFNQGVEQMMTVMPRHATMGEGKFQSEEQLEICQQQKW
jgi:hypothetical protein